MNTYEEIEELLYNNADSFEIAKVLRKHIKNYFSTLTDSFQNSTGRAFLFKHTKELDSFISLAYKAVIRNYFRDYQPLKNNIPITLVALGSYGREQLCVRSDIDIMIVYKDVKGYQTKEIVEQIIQLLWDTSLKLGHRVHSIDELFEVSKTDNTIKTAIIESRFIDGSKLLWTKTQNKIIQIVADEKVKFISQKLEEMRAFHKKYPINMEPNLKEGIGGSRDANRVFWIGKILYNVNQIKQLPQEIVDEEDYREFRIALDFLFRTRSALHLVTNKKEDKLRLELIPSVSILMGYEDNQSDQMKFSSLVITSLRKVRLYSSIWIDSLVKEVGLEYNNKIHYLEKPNKVTNLHTLLKVLNNNDKEPFIAPKSFLKEIIDINLPTVLDNNIYKEIKEIFYQPQTHSILNVFRYSMILGYIISPLKKVMNLPQFDGYHKYAVGEHSMMTLYNIANIRDEKLLKIYNNLNRDEQALLKMVALLHDCGKGRQTEHSIMGASLFKDFAKLINFDLDMIDMGTKLILNHTLMSNVAQKEDLYSDTTIFKFVAKFNNRLSLDMIYLLTYADMNAVGKKIYTNFTSSLLEILYKQSIDALKHDKMMSDIAKRVKKEDLLKKSKQFKSLTKSVQKKILSIPSDLLFLKYKQDKIIDIVQNAINLKEDWYRVTNDKSLTIEVIRKDDLNLSYLLKQLSYLQLINMDIFKLYNDQNKYFKIDFLEKVEDDFIPTIKNYIEIALKDKKAVRTKKVVLKKDDITINCEHSNMYATLKIVSKDINGLMVYFIGIFDSLGIDIVSAKIHTAKNRIEDLFWIEKNGNFCHNKEMILKELTKNEII